MAEGQNQNWGKKGACLGQLMVALIIFAILLIYVYNHAGNQVG